MDRVFKIHCSQIGKIMGRMGLTEKQLNKLMELEKRKQDEFSPLTANMEKELSALRYEAENPILPATATTFLKEWYADDREPIFNKYLDKGNYVEIDLINFMAEQLGFGLAEKNTEVKEDEYFIGSCDVEYPQLIVDGKAMWNNKTLQDNIDCADPDYLFQLRGYMRLWDKPKAILFYGLLNTPPEVNYEREVTFDHIPENQRWIAYEITRDKQIEIDIINRVILCRKWLEQYHTLVTSKLGKTHLI